MKRVNWLIKPALVECSCPNHKGVKLTAKVVKMGHDSWGRVKYWCEGCYCGK